MGTLDRKGYVAVYAPHHPVRKRRAIVAEHRMVLYDKIGPGAHPCHWCGVEVRWEDATLTCDHLDHQPANNDPVNLVPSCKPCNDKRKRGGTALRGEQNGSAKLTQADVNALRAAASRGVRQSELARRYSVHVRTVRKIIARDLWR